MTTLRMCIDVERRLFVYKSGRSRTESSVSHTLPDHDIPKKVFCSGKCNCVRSTVLDRCYIDALKTTEDVVFRMTLLFPAVISEHISRNAKTLNTHAAALCASVGIFVTAWQQQQVEAGFEHPNGRLAHVMLIERLKNAGDYTITTIDENGYEDTSLYNRRKKELNNLFSRMFVTW